MAPIPADIDGLMDRAAAGDDDAFGRLALAKQDELFRFAVAHGLAAADAAEGVQETLLRAYRGRSRWRSGAKAWPWLLAIAMNVVREFRRKRRGHLGGIDIEALAREPGPGGGQQADRLRPLADAIKALPPRQGEVIACRYLRQMSVRETAAAMDCAEGTVKAAVSAALASLRQKLKRHEPWADT